MGLYRYYTGYQNIYWVAVEGISMNLKRHIIALISLTLSAGSYAADWKRIQGIYAVTASSFDPSSAEQLDSHFRFQLTDQSAKDLFLSMKVAESEDECTGAVKREIGAMKCLRYSSPVRYECNFSINLMAQKIEYGVSC